MKIVYKTDKNITSKQLHNLFSSVGWISANYPERLEKAMNNCDTVITAWDNDELIGLVNAIDDGELTAYAHYLLVNPRYHQRGIGRELMDRLKKKYEGYLYLILLSENEKNNVFYEKMGFQVAKGVTPMEILTL